jgi:transcriptional regulator with XRE-family HTH domain
MLKKQDTATASRSTASIDRGHVPSATERGAAIRSVYSGRYTQTQLAAQLGVAQNTISRWSTGDVEPSLEDIARMEDACGVPRGYILRAAGYVAEARSTEEMIAADPQLDAGQRELLLAAYRAAIRQPGR